MEQFDGSSLGLEKSFYAYDSAFGVIDDCYALNIDGETAWTCYYSDFPVVRIVGEEVSGWQNEVDGAATLIVGGSSVALFGGYRPERDRLVLGELADGEFEPRFTGRLVLDDGSELPLATVVGRGSDMHVFVGTDWYRLDIHDIERARWARKAPRP